MSELNKVSGLISRGTLDLLRLLPRRLRLRDLTLTSSELEYPGIIPFPPVLLVVFGLNNETCALRSRGVVGVTVPFSSKQHLLRAPVGLHRE